MTKLSVNQGRERLAASVELRRHLAAEADLQGNADGVVSVSEIKQQLQRLKTKPIASFETDRAQRMSASKKLAVAVHRQPVA